ncbi:hypothetical protein BC828DRAFT_170844 [Blastocladiella britannica]|nr:hypothetical protein BC828DRAFT_170844 [Blastocladiella britannica]
MRHFHSWQQHFHLRNRFGALFPIAHFSFSLSFSYSAPSNFVIVYPQRTLAAKLETNPIFFMAAQQRAPLSVPAISGPPDVPTRNSPSPPSQLQHSSSSSLAGAVPSSSMAATVGGGGAFRPMDRAGSFDDGQDDGEDYQEQPRPLLTTRRSADPVTAFRFPPPPAATPPRAAAPRDLPYSSPSLGPQQPQHLGKYDLRAPSPALSSRSAATLVAPLPVSSEYDSQADRIPTPPMFNRPASFTDISPEAVAEKLQLHTLQRQFAGDRKRAVRQRRMRIGRWLCAAALMVLIVVAVVYWTLFRKDRSNSGSSGNGTVAAQPPAVVPASLDALRNKPVPNLLPATFSSSTLTVANNASAAAAWVTLSPAATFTVTAADSTVKARAQAIVDAARPRVFSASACTPAPTSSSSLISTISVSLNGTNANAAAGTPAAFRIVATSNAVSVSAGSLEALAMALDVLAASTVADASSTGGTCVYRMPVLDTAPVAPAVGLRGVWVDVRSGMSAEDAKSVETLVKVAALTKLSTVILRLPSSYAFDTLPAASRSPTAPTTPQVSAPALASLVKLATERGIQLMPELDLAQPLAWPTAWLLPCTAVCTATDPNKDTCGSVLNLGMPAARAAQVDWWANVAKSLTTAGGLPGAMVGRLLSPAHIKCQRDAGVTDAQLKAHYGALFGTSITVYSPAPIAATAPGPWWPTPVVPVAAAAATAPVTPASASGAANIPAGTASVYYALNVTADGTAVAGLPVRPAGSFGAAGVIVDIPASVIGSSSAESVLRWMYPVAARMWTGWATKVDTVDADLKRVVAWQLAGI